MSSQLRSAKKMAELKPHLDALKEKHGKDRQALAKAQMELYKQQGINPAAGCLPALIQIPILIALYQTILAVVGEAGGLSKINQALYIPSWGLNSSPDLYFLGLNLADKPASYLTKLFSSPSLEAVVVILVPILTALLQFIQSKMMYPKPVKKYPSDSPKEKKEKASTEDAMVAVQGQMMYLMPLMIGYFAFSFPIGLALYWNTFTLFGIWQQYLISGLGGAADLLLVFKSKK